MNRARTLEWEHQWALPAAICAFAAAVLFVAGTVLGQEGPISPTTTTELLRDFHDVSGSLLGAAVLNAFSLALIAAPLFYLFRAALARSPKMRRGLVGVVVAGPLFLGAAELFQWIALNSASNDFATPGGGAGVPIGTYADDLIRDQTTFSISQGLSFAGVLGFVVGTIYTSLWAMRVGLLTRFMGTIGMALAASLLLLAQAFSLLALMLWFVFLGVVILGKTPRGKRPPAWDAGEAIPWPKPGEQPQAPAADADETVDGTATELDSDLNPNSAPGERAKKRKRKRRE
ncbi:MAG: hypothetical protein ABI726_06490 [bacterium]